MQQDTNINKLVSLKDIFNGLPKPKTNKMNDKEKAQAKLDKLLKDFEDCHRKAKRLKEEMRLLKIKIMGMPTIRIDDRPDTLK